MTTTSYCYMNNSSEAKAGIASPAKDHPLLKPDDSERLVRVGRGTPAGELFRRCWMPALLSSEIPGANTQDFALQEGMGPIVDRSKEHLGSSDKAIVTMRRLLLEATQAVERGENPRGTDPST